MDGVDRHKLLNVRPGASITELTKAYRKLALVVHPDKPNGNRELFQLISNTYRELCREIKEAELSHEQLKNNHDDYYTRSSSSSNIPSYFNNSEGKLDHNMFNEAFVKHRIETPDDNGYTAALKKVQFRDAPTVNKDAVESGSFNKIFEEHTKDSVSKTLSKYSVPKPVDLCTIPMVCTQLGQDTTDFTNIANNESQLSYCDLLKAHTDVRLGGQCKIKQKTVKQVQAERSKEPPPMSERDIRRLEKEKIAQERAESARQKTLIERDKRTSLQFYNILKIAMDKK